MATGTAASHQQHQGQPIDELLAAGSAALKAGDTQKALKIFKHAAARNPYHEQVWWALLQVFDDPEDRRVCYENIVAINPYNTDARRGLRAYHDDIERTAQEATLEKERRKLARKQAIRRGIGTFFRGVMMGIGATLVAMILGGIASVIIYGVGVGG
ncbi:MAG: hypothetical protein IAE89_12905 [Anaerolineae bacterium]|nr:hypothetical protein [Anaerolineae bacterium]